jgi:hypothetical protein
MSGPVLVPEGVGVPWVSSADERFSGMRHGPELRDVEGVKPASRAITLSLERVSAVPRANSRAALGRADFRRPRRNVTDDVFRLTRVALARRHRIRLTKSKMTTTSLTKLAPDAALGLGPGAAASFDSRLVRNGAGMRASGMLPRVACIDIVASPAQRTAQRAPSLQHATLISSSGVFPFTSALLGFISALVAGQFIESCSWCMPHAIPVAQ